MTRLERQFREFHARNPHVYKLFCRFAERAIAAGYETFSVAMVVERIRWETSVETSDPDFKINNNHRAYYARMWMDDHPEHPNFFRTRVTRGDEDFSNDDLL